MAHNSSSSVVLLAENHGYAAHYRREKETLRGIRKLGYDTLALELPCDFQSPLEDYLSSKRTEADFRHMMRRATRTMLTDLREHRPDFLEDPGVRRTARRGTVKTNPYFLKNLWLAEDAANLGFKLTCVALPRWQVDPAKHQFTDPFRSKSNRFMANRIATLAKERQAAGEELKLVMAVGSSHVKRLDPPYVALDRALVARGLSVHTFVLAELDGSYPTHLKGHGPETEIPFAARSGQQIVQALEKRAARNPIETAPFRRAVVPAWSRAPEALQEAIRESKNKSWIP